MGLGAIWYGALDSQRAICLVCPYRILIWPTVLISSFVQLKCSKYCLLPIACAKPMPGWMHSAWPGCILPWLDAFGLARMHSVWPGCIRRTPEWLPPRPRAPLRGPTPHGPSAQPPRGRGRRMHPGKTECIQARPNVSSQA